MKSFALPLVLSLVFTSAVAFYGPDSDEEWLKDYLASLKKSSYDKRVAPDGKEGSGSPLTVAASMYIIDIEKVDDSNMDFTAQFYFRQSWKDSRLRFKDRKEDLTLRTVDDIWTPDMFFVEERKGSFHDVVQPNVFCQIKPDGEVLYSVKLSVTFGCPMNLRNYPHDIQKCLINIESYGYQRKHIELEWTTKFTPVTASESIMLEYELIGCASTHENISLWSGEYSRLQVQLTLKRKIGFFTTRLYVPLIFLVLLSISSFWINSEEKCARLALLLVILYLMVTISSEVNSVAPQAPYTKASDVWIGFCESLVFAAFLEFVVVTLISGSFSKESSAKIAGETLFSLDPEAKELEEKSDTMKSPLSKLMSMFNARNGGNIRKNATAERIDRISRIVFPIIFLLFNIVYWSVYCCA